MINKSSLKKRIIPVILIDKFQVVTSKNFSDYRTFGNIEQTIEVFNRRNVDEIIILDITSSKSNYSINYDIINFVSKNTIMPFCFGGGIKNLFEIEKCLKLGCDKINLNTIIDLDKKFLREAVNLFGSQAIVASIDFFKKGNDFYLYNHSTSSKTLKNLSDHINYVAEQGCGEIILTNIEKDGKLNGYDLSVLKQFRHKINCPIILNGGCGSPKDIRDALIGGADACGAGSMFYYTKYSYRDIKDYLKENKLAVR